MPTFDGDNLIITLDSGVTEVDLFDDIYEPWKDWMLASPLNRRYPQAFRSDGGAALSSIINQGSYIFLNNTVGWRIKPPEEDITIYLTGNLAVEDTTLPAFIPTDGAFTAAILGLQPVTQGVTDTMAQQLLHTSFNGGVWVDEANGYTLAQTGDELGTARYPCTDTAIAVDIARGEGFNTIFVIGNATIDTGADYTDIAFVGQGQSLSHFTISAAAIVLNCSFENATVTGTLDGQSRITDCILDGLTFVSGVISNCILEPATIILGGNETAHFIDCESGVPGLGTPTIDCGGSGQALAIRGYSGGIKIINKTGPESVSVDLVSGQCQLDVPTITDGTIVVRGTGKAVDVATTSWLPSGTLSGTATLLNETVHGQMLQDVWQIVSVDAIVERIRDILEADEEYTTSKAIKRRKGTSDILIEKDATGPTLTTPITLTEVP